KEKVAIERVSSDIEEISLDEGEVAAEKGSDGTEEMATILIIMDAASLLLSRGVQVVPTAAAVTPANVSISTSSGVVPTASTTISTATPIFATATTVTLYTRRKGKEKMVETQTPKKKKKLQKQIDIQFARELEEELEREAQRMNAQIARYEEIEPFHTRKLFTTLRVNSPSFSGMIVPLFDTMLVQQGEGSGTPTKPHHTPSPEAPSPSHTTHTSPSLPSVTSTSIPTGTPTATTPIRQYTRRARIAQSSALPTIADEPVSPQRDVSQGEACPTDSGFIADQDRANIAKTSTLPHESTSRKLSNKGPNNNSVSVMFKKYTYLESSTLPTVEYVPASPVRDVNEREACPTESGFITDQDRATIVKSSTLPHDSAPRVTSPAADEGSMQHNISELTALCTSLQRQYSELQAKFETQEEEIVKLKDKVQVLEDREGNTAKPSGDDAPIKGRSINEGEATAERISNDSEEVARVLTSMDAATVLAGGIDVPTGSGSIPTAGPPATIISTGCKVGPTARLIVSRRKGKEVMVESDTPKKKQLQEQIDAQVTK
nr:hypothetical protein [Tanacetum cinerariifolium]